MHWGLGPAIVFSHDDHGLIQTYILRQGQMLPHMRLNGGKDLSENCLTNQSQVTCGVYMGCENEFVLGMWIT